MPPIRVKKGLAINLGSCSHCQVRVDDTNESYEIYEIVLNGVRLRVCEPCRTELAQALSGPFPEKPGKPDIHSKKWREKAYNAVLKSSPPVYPCGDCGWPVVCDRRCSCGGRADRNLEPFKG